MIVSECKDPEDRVKIFADQDKINRLVNYKAPRNKKEARQFIGLLKQLNNWSHKLTAMTTNFRRL